LTITSHLRAGAEFSTCGVMFMLQEFTAEAFQILNFKIKDVPGFRVRKCQIGRQSEIRRQLIK
jgi:hypothetical protein